MRHLLTLLILALAAPLCRASEAADSLERALATHWGSAINLSRLSGAEADAFTRGFADHCSEPNDSLTTQYIRGAMFAAEITRSVRSAAALGLDIDSATLSAALLRVLRGEDVGFTPQQAADYIDVKVAPDEAREFADSTQQQFISAVAVTPGAIQTPSGVVFITLREGSGPNPTAGQTVLTSYTGRLSDGSIFDATSAPVALTIGGLVDGFNEALLLTQVGGQYRIIIPATLAYGSEGIPGIIPGGAALDFTIEIIEIK